MKKSLIWLNLCLLLRMTTTLPVAAAADNAPIKIPRVLDDRLKLEVLAAEPDIVTPTGIATDAKGRVLAIESNTHFRPKDYDGPPADRIRRFEDTDGDGHADRITTFFEGSVATMSAALYRDDSLYVATRNEIFRLRDTDGDGVADERTSLVKLESEDNYPHNGLAGFAFDQAGDVYFGFGENHALSFKLIGSDGKTFSDVRRWTHLSLPPRRIKSPARGNRILESACTDDRLTGAAVCR
jgi:putative membrane-bound dehydrogenase-like protein